MTLLWPMRFVIFRKTDTRGFKSTRGFSQWYEPANFGEEIPGFHGTQYCGRNFPVADRTVEEADDGNRRFFKKFGRGSGVSERGSLLQGFQPTRKNNSIPIPKEGKEERLSRFRNSGCLQIGRGIDFLEHRPDFISDFPKFGLGQIDLIVGSRLELVADFR